MDDAHYGVDGGLNNDAGRATWDHLERHRLRQEERDGH
jgi:hypothetical protein